MSKLGALLIVAGIIFIFSAASNDEFYIEAGEQYPLSSIILWSLAGITCIISGCKISRLF